MARRPVSVMAMTRRATSSSPSAQLTDTRSLRGARMTALTVRRVATFPGGISITTRYDGASRVVAIDNYVTKVDYNERGLVQAVTYANTAKTEFTYNDRLETLTQKSTSGDVKVLDLTYSRNKAGDLTTVADGAPGGERPRHGVGVTYDAWNRVKALSLDRTDAAPETLTFEFDNIDNITSVTSSLASTSRAHVGAFTYDAMHPNAASKAGAVEYAYDPAGSMTKRGGLTLALRLHRAPEPSAARRGHRVRSCLRRRSRKGEADRRRLHDVLPERARRHS